MEYAGRNRAAAVASGEFLMQEELLKRVRTGDANAAAQFVMDYQSVVFSEVMDVLQNEQLATAATRATFGNAVRQLRRGVQTNRIEPWLCWIARNEALALTRVSYKDAAVTESMSRQAMDSRQNAHTGKAYPCARKPREHTDANAPAREQGKRKRAGRYAGGKTGGPAGYGAIIMFIVLVSLVLTWVVMGLLIKNDIVSLPDLGYDWFNSHVFPLF